MLSYAVPSTALLAALFIGATLVPSSLRAQRSAASDTVNIAQLSVAATLGPVALADAPAAGRRVAAVGITRRMHVDALGLVQSRDQRNMGVGPNLALMGTGAAAVVIGLLVGGNGGAAIAVGGGALGLVGFYRYLR